MMEHVDDKDEESIWTVKTAVSSIQQDNGEWKKRRAPMLSGTRIPTQSMMQCSSLSYTDDNHTRIMASLVPDEIIYNITDYSKRELDACLLFGDVSGFTDLCEKYNKSGKGGPSRLTQVLNNYIGAMVQEILSHSGDVLKFSGDAFIALWKETANFSLRDAVHEAIDCALVIQKSYGTYQTDVDVIVRVKLAVASGHLVFSLVGDEKNSHYLMTGQPIYDIKMAESKSSAGEIIITARVSRHLSANEYLIEVLPDGVHSKVLGVGPNWRNIQRHYDGKVQTEKYSILSSTSMPEEDDVSVYSIGKERDSVEKPILSPNRASLEEERNLSARIVTDQYALRPAVNYAARMKMKDKLQGFIIAPVVRGIVADEPLEYLTEIRQVAILFINCKVSGMISAVRGIDVANEVYLTVCNIVKDRYGCVNKISNFDKDLMLLVIFGLRGFKHELESQIALKCAAECVIKIMKIDHIMELAAGVTTGKCYCGAFGHTLRREYTVIGLVVNKAARLMVAYPNKVTCDRETFLHSKLESKNFVLQEYKPLKGIINPGPIYEFREVEKSNDVTTIRNPMPLLGRDQEIDLYAMLLNKAKKLTQEKSKTIFPNMLILQGVYRQGKTRLLEELIYITDAAIPTYRFTLNRFDYDISYQASRYFFIRDIGLEPKVDKDERENRVKNLLAPYKMEPYLNLLNYVLGVRFAPTEASIKLKGKERYAMLEKLFKNLCYACFPQFCVIGIDDAEYIDDESWPLLSTLLNMNLVFVVATMGIARELSADAIKELKSQKIKSIELKSIDKWFHVGLACQMLSVDGIPPELEKTIQVKSNGNPGWIESFLLTLLQSGGLEIKEMTRETAYLSGIVIPPLYMVMRLSEEEKSLWVEIMEERVLSQKEDIKAARWKMFVDSCRESYPDLSVAQTFREKILAKDFLMICTVKPSFHLEDVDPELIIDVIILKTFDALTSYEQLLLKCSAILGDTFPRDMLMYIMSSTATRLTALAVKKLFEILVLSCAKGNFIEGGLNFKERLLDPNEDMTPRCDCVGLLIDDGNKDLPKYASCGYLRFRSSEFRETTYNLLTDNQKREFHERAIRYLEKETRRCRACGNGYFIRQMGGGRIDYDLRYTKKDRRRRATLQTLDTMSGSENFSTRLTGRDSFVSYESSASSSGKTKDYFKQRDTLSIFSQECASEKLSVLDASHPSVVSREFGLTTIRRLKDDFNLAKTFSSIDYSQCTCLLILNTMYSQLIEHCKGAGLVEKIMNATIEYSYVCLLTKNTPQAVKILEEALQLLDGPMREQIELDWMVSLKKGKLFALLGKARMQVDDDEAYIFFTDALGYYGVKFPTNYLTRSFLKCRYKMKQTVHFYLYSNKGARVVDDDVAEYNNNISECLSFLCSFFIKKSRWNEAELSALWSLSKALETETDFEKLCLAYGQAIYVSALIGHHSFCVALEVYSMRMCHRKVSNVELEDLKAVSYLYYTIGRARARRAEIEKFLHIAYVSWRLMTSSQTEVLTYNTLPLLAYMILLRRQILEFANLLQEINDIVANDVDNSGKCWYYALCMCLHLDTCLVAQPYSKCVNYLQGQGMEPTIRDPMGKNRLIVTIWLWEVRNENWEAAIVWQKVAWDFTVQEEGEYIENYITALYLIEGLIIYMVYKMDRKNLKAISRADRVIRSLFKTLTKAQKNCHIIAPRLYHMKAYYSLAKHNNYPRALELLKLGRKYAEQYSNDLEISWMKFSEMAWYHKLPREEIDFWTEHCDEDNTIGFQDLDYIERLMHFTLPVPLYL